MPHGEWKGQAPDRRRTSGGHVRDLVKRRLATFRLTTGMVALAVVLGGCSIGDRQRHADAIRSTLERAQEAGPLAATLSYDVRLHPRSRTQVAALLGAAPKNLSLRTDVTVDASNDRAEVRFGVADLPASDEPDSPEDALAALDAAQSAPAEPEPPAEGQPPVEPSSDTPAEEQAQPPSAAVIFEGSTVFIKRQNLRPRERRTWARLDFDRLPDEEPRPPQDDLAGTPSLISLVTTANPSHVLDVAGGVLAGSTKLRGPATLDGVEFTRYTANVSLEKALTEADLTDEEVEARSLTYRLLGFRQDVVPAQFWLTSDGSLRRLRLDIPQYVNRRRSDRVIVTLDLHGPAPAPVAAAPVPEETVTYQRYGRLLRAALPTV